MDVLKVSLVFLRFRLLPGAAIAAPLMLLAMPAQAQTIGATRCQGLGRNVAVAWPERGTRILSAIWREQQAPLKGKAGSSAEARSPAMPAHCDVIGITRERRGSDGQRYAIRFHLRLPGAWNARFFMQGGGGTEGELGDAIGHFGGSRSSALERGFAVLSEDAGHDNARNTVVERGGAAAFGFDARARADYGGASLPPAVRAAKAVIRAFYRRGPRLSYFVGCSKGGQEGMALAQRFPRLFNGILVGAPGFALPKVAVAVPWDLQRFADIVRAAGRPVTVEALAESFSHADFKLLGEQITMACDADDGLRDGIIGDFRRCTSEKVLPALDRIRCRGAKAGGCLSGAQIEALARIHSGVHDSAGRPLYAGYPWDAGWADAGWRAWKIGGPGAKPPAIDLALSIPALAAIFSVPPVGIDSEQAALSYALSFDFDRDAPRIFSTNARFPHSAWRDIAARSPDLSGFRAARGKMLVYHGVSDPIFSIDDTVDWYEDVEKLNSGRATDFVELFAVPGMNHCGGGPATDDFDAFSSLVEWVERDHRPERIIATAGDASPWPGRRRPLCPFPQVARYRGKGSVEDADSFDCA